MKVATLYEIVNIITKERYVGVTIQKINARWACHLYKLRHGLAVDKLQVAFNKYGESNFVINKIADGDLAEMLLREKELTKATVFDGYNTIIGGGDFEERSGSSLVFHKTRHSDPDRYKDVYNRIGQKQKGKIISEATRFKMSQKKKGVKWEEYKKKNRAIQYSGSGNPNAGNFSIYLHTSTGTFYTTPELNVFFQQLKVG